MALNGDIYPMTGLLPFHARKGQLEVGYRKINCKQDGLIIRKGEQLTGHEFHRWELTKTSTKNPREEYLQTNRTDKTYSSLWEVKGWNRNSKIEGFSTKMIHASWIHLHWASESKIINRWKEAIEINNNNKDMI